MTDFRVSLGDVSAKAEALREQAAAYKSAVDNLGSTEEALNGMWEGEAHSQFDTVFKTDTAQMYKFYELVIQYAEALLNMKQRYDLAEQQNIELARARCY